MPAFAAAWSGEGRISGAADVARALSVVRDGAAQRSTTTALAQPAATADTLAQLRLAPPLPVVDGLADLVPELRRGSVVAVHGATSLWVGLLVAASQAGSWIGVVGVPDLGLLAVADAGVSLDRLALVPQPGTQWAEVVAALIDGMDIVVIRCAGPVSDRTASTLAARARARGTVLLPVGPWPGADLSLTTTGLRWTAPGGIPERAYATAEVEIRDRRRPRSQTVYLPIGHPPADLARAAQGREVSTLEWYTASVKRSSHAA